MEFNHLKCLCNHLNFAQHNSKKSYTKNSITNMAPPVIICEGNVAVLLNVAFIHASYFRKCFAAKQKKE